MRSFELNIFIDRSEQEIYDHLELITLIGLQAFMTTLDILKDKKHRRDRTPSLLYGLVKAPNWDKPHRSGYF